MATIEQTASLGDKTVRRIGFGAMQLASPGVFGPPKDPDAARAVLRRAVELGVNHIDTAQVYGPDVVNELIAEVLRPYPDDLVIATKVGGARDETGAWVRASRPEQLRGATLEQDQRRAPPTFRFSMPYAFCTAAIGNHIQGARDPRVPQSESDQIVERLRARGVKVRYDVYPDEGHGSPTATTR